MGMMTLLRWIQRNASNVELIYHQGVKKSSEPQEVCLGVSGGTCDASA
jgi:hypothetical protein